MKIFLLFYMCHFAMGLTHCYKTTVFFTFIFNQNGSDHIAEAFVSLHWLRVPERIQYKIVVLSHKVLHDTAPRYLGPLTRVGDIPGRRAFRSASTDRLEVPYFKLSTIGGRAFPVAASQIWNSLPDTVVSAPTLRSFQHQLKTFSISTILYLLALS